MYADLRDTQAEVKEYHFIGIGGIGMSASCSDLDPARLSGRWQLRLRPLLLTDQLRLEGADIFIGHSQDNHEKSRCRHL